VAPLNDHALAEDHHPIPIQELWLAILHKRVTLMIATAHGSLRLILRVSGHIPKGYLTTCRKLFHQRLSIVVNLIWLLLNSIFRDSLGVGLHQAKYFPSFMLLSGPLAHLESTFLALEAMKELKVLIMNTLGFLPTRWLMDTRLR
jgi:hypothetical protein